MASTVIGALRVVLSAETGEFSTGLKRAEKELSTFSAKMSRIGSGLQTAGAAMTAAFTLPMIGIGVAAVQAAKESADAAAQVEASLKSMGGASGKTLADLQKQADALMKSSLFDDDDILRNVTANLLTFGNVAGPVFDRAQVAVVDLATRMKMDLQSATILVGKALNDPVKGLKAMARAGIQFTDQQVAMVKALVKGGQAAQAQAIILAELERQFAGSAKAAQAADPVNALQDSLNTLSETLGQRLLPMLKPMVDRLNKLAEGFANLSPATQDALFAFAGVAAVAGPVTIALGATVAAMATLVSTAAKLPIPLKAALVETTALSLANIRLTFTSAAVSAAMAGQGTVMALLTGVVTTLATALGALGRAFMLLIGGPIGLALTYIAGGFIALAVSEEKAAARLRSFQRENAAAAEGMAETAQWSKSAASGTAGLGTAASNAITGVAALTGEVDRLADANFRLAASYKDAELQRLAGKIGEENDLRERIRREREDAIQRARREQSAFESDPRVTATDAGRRASEARIAKAVADARAPFDRMLNEVDGRITELSDRVQTVVDTPLSDQRLRDGAAAAGAFAGSLEDAGSAAGGAAAQTRDFNAELEQLYSRYMTPEQGQVAQRAADYQLLADAFARGAITATQLATALRMMREERERANFDKGVLQVDQNVDLQDNPFDDWTTYRGKVMTKEQQEELRRQTEDAFRGGLEALRYGGAKGVMEYLANSFADRLLDKLSKQLADIFDRLIEGMGSGQGGGVGGVFGAIGSIFSSGPTMPGFATGGSFTVGGAGGIDSQLMMFRATPGEMVNITHGNDNGPGGGALSVHVEPSPYFDVTVRRISAEGDAQVVSSVVKAQQAQQQANRYRVGRGAA